MIIVLLLILIFLIYVWMPDRRPVTETTVWTYWHNPVPPTIIRRCHENWRKVGLFEDIRFLNAFTVHKYIPTGELLRFAEMTNTEAHKSDLIRFYLLKKYGGIWIDSSVFFNKPADWLPEGFFCYKADRFSKEGLICLENFFIKSPPGHPFLVQWAEQTEKEFMDPDYKTNNERYRKIIGANGDYLVPYVASMKLEKVGITYESAEEDPYFDTEKHGWYNTEQFCHNISHSTRVVKLWNLQRRECSPDIVPLVSAFKDYSPTGVYEKFKPKFEHIDGESGEVDMTYVISMPDREEYIKGVMSQFKCEYKLFHAIKPDDLTPEDYENMSETMNSDNKMLYKQMTKLPVCLSFFMCYWDAYTAGYSSIAVFEDDIKFVVSIDQILSAMREFKKLPEGEILFLGYCWANCEQQFEQVSENLYRAPTNVQLLCNHALVMKKDFLKKFMERHRPNYWRTRNDHTLSDFLRREQIGKFVTPKAYVNQNRAELGSNNGNYDLGGKACDLTNQ